MEREVSVQTSTNGLDELTNHQHILFRQIDKLQTDTDRQSGIPDFFWMIQPGNT